MIASSMTKPENTGVALQKLTQRGVSSIAPARDRHRGGKHPALETTMSASRWLPSDNSTAADFAFVRALCASSKSSADVNAFLAAGLPVRQRFVDTTAWPSKVV